MVTLGDYFLEGRPVRKHPERLLQEIFVAAAIIPSIHAGLITMLNLTAAGDGTCLPVHASPYGIKECDCQKNGIWGCKCKRRYADPDARWGWDSSKEQWFYDHEIYFLSCYNPDLKVDLPLYMQFFNANRHDSVSVIFAMAEFRELCPQLPIANIVLDSAHDNYPACHLCREWDIIPFIDLNPTNNGNVQSVSMTGF